VSWAGASRAINPIRTIARVFTVRIGFISRFGITTGTGNDPSALGILAISVLCLSGKDVIGTV
jgi:hypothetical protein